MEKSRTTQERRINLRASSDEMLVELTREGATEAYGELWERHRGAVTAIMRSFTGFEPEDLMQEAFMKVYSGLLDGTAIPASFRAYVATTARRIAIDMHRRGGGARTETFEDHLGDEALSQADFSERTIEDSTTAAAFAQLPTKQREALWYREVEDLPVQEVARYLGMSPNTTTQLLKRAKDTFMTAWIKVQLSPGRNLHPECRPIVDLIPRYSRGKLSPLQQADVELHLADCAHCALVAAEADNCKNRLALVLLPMLLLGAAPSYLRWIQDKENRVPIPAQANYLPVTFKNVSRMPVAAAGAGVALGAGVTALSGPTGSDVEPHERPPAPVHRRNAYMVAAAAAAAVLLIGGAASALIRPWSEVDASTKVSQGDESGVDSWLADRGDESGEEDSVIQAASETPTNSQSTGNIPAITFGGEDASVLPETPAGNDAVVPPTAVPSPAVDVPPQKGETNPGINPANPAPFEEEDLPVEEEPAAVVYETPVPLSTVSVYQPNYFMAISATKGATVKIRATAPRTNSSSEVWDFEAIVDANGEVTYDFPHHRGMSVRVVIVQEYLQADGLQREELVFSTLQIPVS